MIARIDPSAGDRDRLIRHLVPADLTLWKRTASIEEPLLTWWAVMVQLQEAIASRRDGLSLSAHYAAAHFKRVGQILRLHGAVSGAELSDGAGLAADGVRHGSWRYDR